MPIQLTSQAYCKMLLHAAKYPHYAVNGLLVAEKTKDKKKDGHSDPVLCVDCVPLFHGTLALAPMLEVALTLVSIWQLTRALRLVGLCKCLFCNKRASWGQVFESFSRPQVVALCDCCINQQVCDGAGERYILPTTISIGHFSGGRNVYSIIV